MTQDERLMDKVRKLLTKAEGTDNQEEADAFFAKAEELMIANSISEDAVRSRMGQEIADTVIRVSFEFTGIFRNAERDMCGWVGSALGFRTVHGEYKKNVWTVWWVGFSREIEDAQVLFNSFILQRARAFRKFTAQVKRDHPYIGKQDLYVMRRSFIEGFGTTIHNRIKATRRSVIQEATKVDDSLLPVLVKKDELVDAATAEFWPRLGKGRSARHSVSGLGFSAGSQAGKSADIGQKRMAGQRAIGA